MKKNFNKFISMILVLTFLVSMLSVFIVASDEPIAETSGNSYNDGSISGNDVTIYYNRTFEEGWEYTNGLESTRVFGNNFFVDYEETIDYTYNYFWRLEAANTSSGKARLNVRDKNIVTGGAVLEFSIKADDVAALGTILTATTSGREQTYNVLSVVGNKIVAFPDVSVTNEPADCTHPDVDGNGVCDYNNPTVGATLGTISNDWLDIAFIFDLDKENVFCTILYGENYENSTQVEFSYKTAGDNGIRWFDFGFVENTSSERIGMSVCIDNLKFYTGAKQIAKMSTEEHGYGNMIDTIAEKTVDIQAGSNVKSKNRILSEALCLKLGVNYALYKNERVAIYDGTYGAPLMKTASDGTKRAMVPLDLLLEFIGYRYNVHPDGISYDIATGTSATYITAGRDTANVGGERVYLTAAPGYITAGDKQYLTVSIDDVETLFPGWLTLYDDMGLIIIYEDTTPDNKEDNTPILSRETELSKMLDIMKAFIFDTHTSKNMDDAYVEMGEDIYSDVKKATNEFTHPYIMANEKTFETLFKAYRDPTDQLLKSYLDSVITTANKYFADYAATSASGAYAGIKADKSFINEYADAKNPEGSSSTIVADTADGYDKYGRFDMIVEKTEMLPYLAFAYQVSGDEKYAKLAYDIQSALAEWEHWGPAYMVNCAEALMNYAIAYDWLYNAYKTIYGEAGVNNIAAAIYALGVHDGYVASTGAMTEHPREKGDSSHYTTMTDHWNAVSSSGMIIGALSILGYAELGGNVYSESVYLLGNNIYNLTENGLDLYAPDGSYIESVTHWELATTSFIKMVMALVSSTGSDYGLMNTWGIDKTCYYACHIESPDGLFWNYNDTLTPEELRGVNTEIFNFVGSFYGDDLLLAQRKAQIADGKSAGILDLLAYPTEAFDETIDLPLTYTFEGLEAHVIRGSWEKGAAYVGIMGGANNCPSGQVDSGNFIYHNKGVVWFADLGTENPDAFQYYSSSKYKYYRANAEGQNVMFVSNETDLIYGQHSTTGGKLMRSDSNEKNAYVMLDNTDAYYGKLSLAKRGIFSKNNGETVIIQDELSCVDMEEMIWVAQTEHNVVISADGKTAYIIGTNDIGERYTLRATLLSRFKDLIFEVNSSYDFSLGATYRKNDSKTNGGEPEYDRSGISKLIVKTRPVLSFDMAVVLEIVSDVDDPTPVNYTLDFMNTWDVEEEIQGGDISGETAELHGTPNKADIMSASNAANLLVRKETALTEKIENFYANLSKVSYTIEAFGGIGSFTGGGEVAIIDAYNQFRSCLGIYNDYRDFINENADNVQNVAKLLIGFDLSEE